MGSEQTMTNSVIQENPNQGPVRDDEIDLVEVGRTLWKGRKLIISVTAAGMILSGIVSFTIPNSYTASATIMPLDSSSDRLSAAMSALGALGGLASQAGVSLKGSISDKFVALLKSRTVAESVITKHKLLPILFADRWDSAHATWKPSGFAWFQKNQDTKAPTLHEAIRCLNKTMSTTSDPKTGLITISVDLHDPQAAADVANHYVIELNAFLQGNSLSSAKRNKDFLENQVLAAKQELGGMEAALKDFQEQHKLVSIDAQADASIQAYAALKSQLTAKEMELNLQANTVSEDDMQLVGLKKEVAQLREKIDAIENGSSEGLLSFKDAPNLGMKFAQLKRDLLVKQKVFELLTQQLEIAKVDEAKETLSFQLIDKAIAPDKKSKPNRSFLIVLASVVSFVLGGMAVVVLDKRKAGHDRRANEQFGSKATGGDALG